MSKMSQVSDNEKELLRHTLGLDRGSIVYRNHFVAGPRHDELPILEALIEKGFMQLMPTPSFCPKDDKVFAVTKEGERMAKS